MRRAAVTVATAVMVLMVSVAHAGMALHKVAGGPGIQYWASSNGEFVAYTDYRKRRGTALIQNLTTGRKTRVAPGQNFMGSFIPGTDRLVYDHWDGRQDDLYFYDVSSKHRTKAPAKVNSGGDEFLPLGSADHLLFLRNTYTKDGSFKNRSLVLFDRGAGRQRLLLRRIRQKQLVLPTFVGSSYAAWTECNRDACRMRYLDIASGDLHTVSNPHGRSQYGLAFDETAHQMYFVRSANGKCGVNVTIRRSSIGGVSTSERIAALPKGVDTGWTLSLAPNPTSMMQDLYFERYDCKHQTGDVYRVDSVAP